MKKAITIKVLKNPLLKALKETEKYKVRLESTLRMAQVNDDVEWVTSVEDDLKVINKIYEAIQKSMHNHLPSNEVQH